MRAVWAAVSAVWAMLALVAVLAWSRGQAPSPPASATPTVRVVTGKNGQQLVLAQAVNTTHATTQSSPTAGAFTDN